MRFLLRFLGWVFAGGTIMFFVGMTGVAATLWYFSKDLPDYSQLPDYEPAVMTRVHASDGSLLAEYAKERRLYLPIQAIPKSVINAFIAAEDKSFDQHPTGRQDLPADQRAVCRAQDQGSAAGDEDRAHLVQGEDPRALSQ